MKQVSILVMIAATGLFHHVVVADGEATEQHKLAILEQYPEAKFTNVEVEKRKGKKVYEYEFKVGKVDYEAFIGEDGTILKIEED